MMWVNKMKNTTFEFKISKLPRMYSVYTMILETNNQIYTELVAWKGQIQRKVKGINCTVFKTSIFQNR